MCKKCSYEIIFLLKNDEKNALFNNQRGQNLLSKLIDNVMKRLLTISVDIFIVLIVYKIGLW